MGDVSDLTDEPVEESHGNQIVNIAGALHMMDRLRVDHPEVIKCLEIAPKLQEWVDANCGATRPLVNVMITENSVSLGIGDFTVWESDNFDEDELTLKMCKEEYTEDIKDLAQILVPAEGAPAS